MQGLDVHIANLDPNFRRQAHQFLLTCELDGFPANCDTHDSEFALSPSDTAGALCRPTEKTEANEDKSSDCEVTEMQYRAAQEQFKALKCKADLEEVHADYHSSQHRPSRLQRDVALILSEMDIGFVEEYVDKRSGYSLDMLLSDRLTAIEVDGPSHYATGTHRPLGNTNMKHRHIAQLVFDLRILPYWEWDVLKVKDQKKAYLRQLLTSTCTPSVTS